MSSKTKKEKIEERQERAKKMSKKLHELFPEARTALNYSNDWELLVATILSAQCTDKRVNEVVKELFNKYKTLDDYVNADPEEFAEDIRSTGFYKNKTKNILAAAKMLKEEYNGELPKNVEELTNLPGVARKTANVVLANAYGIAQGIAVDTHVKRLTRKFDLTDETDPDKIEKDLMEILPKEEWIHFPHALIEYGRKYCPAKKHDCSGEPLTEIYPQAANQEPTDSK